MEDKIGGVTEVEHTHRKLVPPETDMVAIPGKCNAEPFVLKVGRAQSLRNKFNRKQE